MKKLKIYGITRVRNNADEPTSKVILDFNRVLTAEEMKQLRDGLRDWINYGKTIGGEISQTDTSSPVGKVWR